MTKKSVVTGLVFIILVAAALWLWRAEVARAPGMEATSTPGGGGILPYNSGVQGTVSLGPTCPVERIPPDPACADKPYATTISVSHEGSTGVFATGKSDSTGAFKISLPPGSYIVSAQGGTTLPRCAPVSVVVGPAGYATADISCDTGVR